MSASESRQIAGRYATALFELATQKNEQDAVQKDLQAVVALANTNAEFADLLESPIHNRVSAASALEAILRHAKSSSLTIQFFVRLAKNRRLALTPMIAEIFAFRLEQSRGEITAEITSASPMDAASKDALSKSLSASTGKVVKLRLKEDSDILGGLIVKLGGKMLDASVSGRMERMKQSLKA